MLGYHDPELTSRPTQIRDWYDSEEGLDLRALDGDCAQLRAAAASVMEALRMQRAQVDELAAAWSGPGAESAIGFLQRHCDAANTVATEVRAAAAALRVAARQPVAPDRRQGRDGHRHRRSHAGAAAGVVGRRRCGHDRGGGSPTTAEVVQQQIKPYVDNDIRAEWLTAMRSARAGVATSYDMVTDKFAAAAPVYFEIPEDQRPGRGTVSGGPGDRTGSARARCRASHPRARPGAGCDVHACGAGFDIRDIRGACASYTADIGLGNRDG